MKERATANEVNEIYLNISFMFVINGYYYYAPRGDSSYVSDLIYRRCGESNTRYINIYNRTNVKLSMFLSLARINRISVTNSYTYIDYILIKE